MRETDSIDPTVAVKAWLQKFEEALSGRDTEEIAELFTDDCYWRDILAFTWQVHWIQGRTELQKVMLADLSDIDPSDFVVAPGHTEPSHIQRVGRETLEAFIEFRTRVGRAKGVLRLVADDSSPVGVRAWTILTALQNLNGGDPLPVGVRKPGSGFDRTAPRTTWSKVRETSLNYRDHEPEVFIVGGGQAGVMVAAQLVEMGVDTLVVDRHPRIGDNWRKRYESLALHTTTDVVHFPLMRFPDAFPTYLPKDKMANWFEHYVEAFDINYWTSTEFVSGEYDEDSQRWRVTVLRDGVERVLSPRHVIMAVGADAGAPYRPQLPGLETFSGLVKHSSEFRTGADFPGARVLVVGVGTSGHDIAFDLYRNGADVTLVQRGSTTVINLDSANIPFRNYVSERSTEEADLLAAQDFTYPLLKQLCVELTKLTNELDAELLDSLRAVGMKLDSGEDETGYVMKLHRYRGGYYINIGCSELIADRKIGLLQYDDVDRFVPSGLLMQDGDLVEADVVILATGYENQQANMPRYFGADVAEKVGPIIGLDERGEYVNTFVPTAQKALWFSGGGIPSCRPYSRYLAVQVKAALTGEHPSYRDPERYVLPLSSGAPVTTFR